jgi:hypothetical protein
MDKPYGKSVNDALLLPIRCITPFAGSLAVLSVV